MKKEMICIVCPMSCHLSVTQEKDKITVIGNTCPRGAKYGQDELLHPTRMVTTTVSIQHATIARLPVITSQPVAKELIFKVMEEAGKVEVYAPVKKGDILVRNIADSGADLIASRSLK